MVGAPCKTCISVLYTITLRLPLGLPICKASAMLFVPERCYAHAFQGWGAHWCSKGGGFMGLIARGYLHIVGCWY